MIDVKIEVVGDKVAALHFRGAGRKAPAGIELAMGRIVLKLMRESVQNKLSGQVLNRVTGTLARSVTQSPRLFRIGDTIVGTVGVSDLTGKGGRAPVKYGRAHEYGFQGVVSVKQHLRQIREQGRMTLFKTSASKDFGVFRKARGKKTGAVATVSAHTRTVKLPVRSFLRTALEDLVARNVPVQEIERAIEDALK